MENVKHIAFIMDGNRRWARKFFLSQKIAYSKGIDSMLDKIKFAKENKIPYLTFFCLSEENFRRTKTELDTFFSVLSKRIEEIDVNKLIEMQLNIKTLGNINLLPENIKSSILSLQSNVSTEVQQPKLTICFAIAYGGRQEILKACKQVLSEGIKAEELTEGKLQQYLYTANIPDPDLMIRTGGDCRLSNFLLWQLSYSEFYFSKKLWPAFDNKDLICAIEHYLSVKRNYGK